MYQDQSEILLDWVEGGLNCILGQTGKAVSSYTIEDSSQGPPILAIP